MSGHSRHLPADERRAATVEAVVDLAAEQNPSDITTTAIAQRMGLTQEHCSVTSRLKTQSCRR